MFLQKTYICFRMALSLLWTGIFKKEVSGLEFFRSRSACKFCPQLSCVGASETREESSFLFLFPALTPVKASLLLQGENFPAHLTVCPNGVLTSGGSDLPCMAQAFCSPHPPPPSESHAFSRFSRSCEDLRSRPQELSQVQDKGPKCPLIWDILIWARLASQRWSR